MVKVYTLVDYYTQALYHSALLHPILLNGVVRRAVSRVSESTRMGAMQKLALWINLLLDSVSSVRLEGHAVDSWLLSLGRLLRHLRGTPASMIFAYLYR